MPSLKSKEKSRQIAEAKKATQPKIAFTPSYPGEQIDPDITTEEITRRTAEREAFLRSMQKSEPETLHLPRVEDAEQIAEVKRAVEEASAEVALVTDELVAFQRERTEMEAERRLQQEQADAEWAQKEADLQRRESLARSKAAEAQQLRDIADVKVRANQIAEAERVRRERARAAKAEKDRAVRHRLAPRVAAVGAELSELKKVDTSPVQTLATMVKPPHWPATARDRWDREVRWPAEQAVASVNSALSHLPGLLREAEEAIERGWEPRADHELTINTLMRDLGYAIGRTANVKRIIAVASSRAKTFDKLFEKDATREIEYDEVRGHDRQLMADALGRGRIGITRSLDIDVQPTPGEQRYADGVESGRPRV